MTKSEEYYKNLNYKLKGVKKCECCGAEFNIYITRDLTRKRFCSRKCFGKTNSKINNLIPPKPTPESRKRAGKTLSSRIKSGEISLPPRRKSIYPNKYCAVCNKKIYYTSISNLCKTHFNLRPRKNHKNLKIVQLVFPFQIKNTIKKKKMAVEFLCDGCRKVSYKKPCQYHKNKKNFCSIRCACRSRTSKKKIKFICNYCHQEFEKYESLRTGKNIFCSRSCAHKYPHPKRQTTLPLRKAIKRCPKYKQWRKEVYKKDKWICTKCFSTKEIHAHHIIPFASLFNIFLEKNKGLNPEVDINQLLVLAELDNNLWDVNNGAVLCKTCHQKEHPDVHLNSKCNKKYAITSTNTI